MKAASAAGPPPGSAADRILASGVFDVEWYQYQTGLTFADRAEAVNHYVEEGRRAGWSPHPRRYYRSAVWALNDHWSDMRDRGFVSNRVFDVLASGGRLLTDEVEGLDEITRTVLPERGLARFRTTEDLDTVLAEESEAWYDDTSHPS